MVRWTLLIALLALGACAPAPDGRSDFGTALDDLDDPADQDNGDDDDESPPDPTWDSTPPEVQVGDTVTFHVTCGFFLEPFAFETSWGELGWEMGGPPDAAQTPTLAPCDGEEDPPAFEMEWSTDELYLLVGELEHLLEPGQVEESWVGVVFPVTMTPACEEAMLSLGYDDLRVPIVMDVVSVDGAVL